MSFLIPIWLLSIAAVSIPLLIHLWNITPAKTLKVGSISLIELSSRKRSRSLKLADILLLLLRCLFIVLLAAVLALPYFKNQDSLKKQKGWLLIPKQDFKEAYEKFKPKVDSLLKAGYQLHYFNTDFKKVSLSEALSDTTNQTNETPIPYWSLLQQLEQQTGASLPVYLITPDLLNKFGGNRPTLGLNLNWQTYTPTDSTSTSIKKAWFTPDKNIHVVVTTSSPGQTYQHPENVNPTSTANSPYSVEFKDGSATISLKNDEKNKVKIDTPPLTVDVFSASGALDGDYIKAALQSIVQFSQQNIIVKNYNAGENSPLKHDWLFWLSDKTLDANVLSRYKNVFVYENGKMASSKTALNYADDNSLSSGKEVISVFKTVTADNDNNETIWQDGFGTPLLTSELKGETHLFHFCSKFNPSWNELVWNAAFPQIIQRLIYPDEHSYNVTVDRRTIDAKQIKSIVSNETGMQTVNYEQHTDITNWFWLLMILIFALERWLAHKNAGRAVAT